MESTKWIAHTYDVQVVLGDVQTDLSTSAHARTIYLNSGDPSYLSQYESAKTEVHDRLALLRQLTKDNPAQQKLCNPLDDLVLRRMELLDISIELRKSGPLDEDTQLRLSRENATLTAEFMDVMENMMQEERRMLNERRQISGHLFSATLGILGGMFVLAILLFWIHFRLLNEELAERERTEGRKRPPPERTHSAAPGRGAPQDRQGAARQLGSDSRHD